ncbi:hypothetical protein HA402_000750 [Bradysia odoriphaga]|nr:hypothetical protein HA402_000750 [Bradysia odoriphaga]
MPKNTLKRRRDSKILTKDDREIISAFDYDEICDFDDKSDSEEEHISDASEEDDELSYNSDIDTRKFIIKSRVKRVAKHKAINSRRKVCVTKRKPCDKNLKAGKRKAGSQATSKDNFFISKDGTKWKKSPFPEMNTDTIEDSSFEIPNIPVNIKTNSPMDFFKLYFTDDVCAEIVKWTNMAALRFYNSNEDWKMVDKDELYAFLGLLISAGHMKSCNENYRNFWHPFYGSKIFKATMGMTRFEQLLRFIRFDDQYTRSARRKTDKLAPIRSIWEKVTGNFKKYYIPSQNLTIDEQLMPCRCRCSFIQFMPKKPDKYGIKIFWICDSRNAYPLQGFVYTGKNGDKRTVDLAKTVVETLCASYYGTKRNITTDNYFTSFTLAESLISNGLNLVGTLKKNKTCVPPEFLPNRTKKEGSTMFGFRKDITLASHVPKVGKAVLFLSTMHHNNNIITEDVKKPMSQINKHYNATKSGVDTMDQMVHEYMTKRKTNRWPFSFFMNLLDVSNIAAYTLWCKKFPSWNSKKSNKRNLFLRALGEEMVTKHVLRRQKIVQLRQSSREAISEFLTHVQGGEKAVKRKIENVSESLGRCSSPPDAKRRRCHMCPSVKSKMQKQFCHKCHKNVCNDHSTFTRLCLDCKN